MPIDYAQLDLRDALDLAILIEEEARQRYEEFTHLVGGRYPGDAADVFRTMAGFEAKHEAELAAERAKRFGDAPRRISLEQLDDVEAPDRNRPRVFMSARQAVEVALYSEEKAHDFFAALLPHVKDPDVHALFEGLRVEELRHQQFLRERLEQLPPGPDVPEDEADEPPALD
jgi:erythrin-vacuolar iron transport family protein